jgi:hypothetical protein
MINIRICIFNLIIIMSVKLQRVRHSILKGNKPKLCHGNKVEREYLKVRHIWEDNIKINLVK